MNYTSCSKIINENNWLSEPIENLRQERLRCHVILFSTSNNTRISDLLCALTNHLIEVHVCQTYKDIYLCLKAQTHTALLFDTEPDGGEVRVSERAIDRIQSEFPWLRIVALVPEGEPLNVNLKKLLESGLLYDYHSLPVDEERLVYSLGHIQGLVELERKYASADMKMPSEYGGIIGASPSMRRVYEMIRRVSRVNTPVLITGESGTGKELVAQAIHNNSPSKSGKFAAINCAALPPNLIESELFGYEPGAFTGAHGRKIGLIEEAHNGTLFLDEIGDMPLELQPHFLRFLQDGTFKRVGGTETRRIKTRIIAATNIDLKEAIREDTFRKDLYYRLNVVPVEMPLLRERGQDIEILAHHFLQKFCKEYRRPKLQFSRNALIYLLNYSWPGNVRELISAIGRAVVMVKGKIIRPADFQMDYESGEDGSGEPVTLTEAREAYDRKFITLQLKRNMHNIQKTADDLDISRVALYRLIKRYNITRPKGDISATRTQMPVLLLAAFMITILSITESVAQQNNVSELQAMRQKLDEQAEQLQRQATELAQQRRELNEQRRQLMELVRQTAAGSEPADTESDSSTAGQQQSSKEAATTRAVPSEGVATKPPKESRPEQEITIIADVGGVLTPKGTLTFEPSISASHTSSNRFFFQGVEIVDAVLIGAIEATESRRNYLSAQMGFRYGVTNRLEVSAKVPFVYRDDRLESTILSEQDGQQGEPTYLQNINGTNLGDIEFGAQYQLNDGQKGWPYFIANLRAKSDTGKGPFDVDRDAQGLETELPTGAGFWSLEPSVTMLLQSDPGVFFANLGYIWNIGRDINLQSGGNFIGHVNPGDTISASLGVGFALNETLSMSFGYQHNYIFGTKSQVNSINIVGNDFQVGSLLFGTSLGIGRFTGLSMNVAVGVTDDSPDVEFSLRMPFSIRLFE